MKNIYKIGFWGTGKLGIAIAKKLIQNNLELFIHNRTMDNAKLLINEGAIWCDQLTKVFTQSDIIFICVSHDNYTNELFSNPKELNIYKQKIIIDLSTISPLNAGEIASKANLLGSYYYSCPVSGGVEGVYNNSLAAIISGNKVLFDNFEYILRIFIDKITWVSNHEEALKLKILNNLAESINLLGALEIINLGLRLNIPLSDMESTFTTCRGRSAYMDVALGFLKNDCNSTNVSLHVRNKDIKLAQKLNNDNGGTNNMLSDLTINIFSTLLEKYSGTDDQCSYFNYLNPIKPEGKKNDY